MPWIESHQSLQNHPKLIALASDMGWDADQTIGKLSRFWWWCLDYAIDGNLSNFNDAQIAHGMGVAIPDSKRLVTAMVAARWLDREPYFRVHDWWDYVGRFLKVKWKDKPDEWRAVQAAYAKQRDIMGIVTHPVTAPVAHPVTRTTYLSNQPTNRTNQPTDPPTSRAGECKRLHGIPANVEEVIEYGKLCNPIISEARCRAFWSHYEGQARTSPNGDVFWVTSGEAVVTNWRVKLPEFGNGKDGAAQRVGASAGAFPPSITQQIASIKFRLEEVQRELNKIGCPPRDVFPAEYEVATKKRAPLIEEKSKLQGRLRELHQTVAAT